MQTLISEIPVQAGIPCEVLVRDLGLGTKKVLQTVRYARIPGLGRYKEAWDLEAAEKLYASVPDTPEGRQEFIDKFRADGLAGKTTFIESMVALRVLHPQEEGRKIWEIFTDAELVVVRKRLQLNPIYLFVKVARHLLHGDNVDVSPEEQMYLNGLVYKGKNLYLTKLTYPRRITNIDAHLVSLAQIAYDIKTKQGDPFRAVVKFMNTLSEEKFQKDLQDTLLDKNYGISPEEYQKPEFKPFKTARTAFVKEIELKNLDQRQFFIEFTQGVTDPEKYFRYTPEITPLDIKAFNEYGPMGLLEAMRSERGTLAAIGQFKRAFVASMVFRTLVILAVTTIGGLTLWNTFRPGNRAASGAGAAVNAVNPGAAVPRTAEDDQATDDKMVEAGTLCILTPGLLDDVVDPTHPERNPSPCDPQRRIRDQAQRLRQTGRYADDGELLNRNPSFRIQGIMQIQRLSNDPSTGCRERVNKIYQIDQLQK